MSSKKYCVASKAESGSSCSWGISGGGGGKSKDSTNLPHESLISFILVTRNKSVNLQINLWSTVDSAAPPPTRHDVHLVEELQLLDEVPVIQNACKDAENISDAATAPINSDQSTPFLLPRPLMNSRKLMSPSQFWSSRRKKRTASRSDWAPLAQGNSCLKSPLNCSVSMRYCSRYGRLGSWRSVGWLLPPQ